MTQGQRGAVLGRPPPCKRLGPTHRCPCRLPSTAAFFPLYKRKTKAVPCPALPRSFLLHFKSPQAADKGPRRQCRGHSLQLSWTRKNSPARGKAGCRERASGLRWGAVGTESRGAEGGRPADFIQ